MRIISFSFLFSFIFVFSSCVTTKTLDRKGVSRVKAYDFRHDDIPLSFNDFRIAFVSDFHYKSILQKNGLNKTVKLLQKLDADILLMGGDYVEQCENAHELFSSLAQVKTRFGTYGVMGNNDYELCYNTVINEMNRFGMKILEHAIDTINIENEKIFIAGIKNPFDLRNNHLSPSTILRSDDFVILLCHTPDYAEKGNITNTDLFLAGHTHGGQITFLGFYAPVTNSSFGGKFRTGKKKNSHEQTMIITKGIGTSRKQIRVFTPPEIVLITLKSKNRK